MNEQAMTNEQEKARQAQVKWGRILKGYLLLYLIASIGLVIHALALLAEF